MSELLTSVRRSLVVALMSSLALAQAAGDALRASGDPRLLLKYATFDPLGAPPAVPAVLRAGADVRLWIVQFHGAPTDADRAPMLAAGARVHGYLPHDSHIVRMDAATSAVVAAMPGVRWVGAYEPAYRLEAELLTEIGAGRAIPTRAYNMVMADKRNEKEALAAKVVALGGKVVDRHVGGLLFTAELTGAQLIAAARLDEVVWIDRWTPPGEDMDNARIVQGSNAVESAAGYTGAGVRGHVYEGVEATHPDFTTPMTNVLSDGSSQAHGHCTAGCIFGNGASAPQARGHAPAAVGFYTNYLTVTAGTSRNTVINAVVNTHQCMFTTASWGSAQTTQYTADSADADDIVFDHRIPWTNSMSNLGNQSVRPQAWAKNVISVGGLSHGNNANPADDVWTTASVGPAADGRIKPDLCNFYDNVWTSDLSGAAGYSTGNSTTGFNGTSSATPITAGLNALAIQMYTDHILNNAPRVVGGTRFQNRPYAQTLKALQIACASQYPVAQATRPRAGWGYANVNTIHARRNKLMIVPEDVPITQGATQAYSVQVAAGETALRICMTYLEPPAVPAAAQTRINDLTLRVVSPTGVVYFGNNGLSTGDVSTSGGVANTIDTVECVVLNNPTAGVWTVEVLAPVVAQDANLATPATDATYALVVNGGIRVFGSGCARYVPDTGLTGTPNFYPWGGIGAAGLTTMFASNNGGSVGGMVYFDVTVTNAVYLSAIKLNATTFLGPTVGTVLVDVYRTAAGGTYVGNTGNVAAWLPVSAGKGDLAGLDLPTRFDLKTPILLTPGTYGFAIKAIDFAHNYTNGTGINQNYSDPNIAIATGAATNLPFESTPFFPRVPNMSLEYVPTAAAGTNMRYQALVRAGELGGAGGITGLAFSFAAAARHWNSSLLVRMSHVPAGHVMSATFASNLPTPVTVLDQANHSFQFASGGWTEIGLQSPFAYNGASDVVVDITAVGNVMLDGVGAYRSTAVTTPRVTATSWSGVAPTSGFVDGAGARMRLSFNCANANEFGASCGRLEAAHAGTGARGTPFGFVVNNAPPSLVAFLSLGLANGAPYPLSLGFLGWTNCYGYHDPVDLLTVSTNAAGVGAYNLPVPNNPALDGFKVYGTWLGLDPAEPGGLTFSGYTRMVVGQDP